MTKKTKKILIIATCLIGLAVIGYFVYQKYSRPYDFDRCLKENMVKTGECCANCNCTDSYLDNDKFFTCLKDHNIKWGE